MRIRGREICRGSLACRGPGALIAVGTAGLGSLHEGPYATYARTGTLRFALKLSLLGVGVWQPEFRFLDECAGGGTILLRPLRTERLEGGNDSAAVRADLERRLIVTGTPHRAYKIIPARSCTFALAHAPEGGGKL